ncbi:unnamed protein product, partial [Closterium sp. Naga37s-1]
DEGEGGDGGGWCCRSPPPHCCTHSRGMEEKGGAGGAGGGGGGGGGGGELRVRLQGTRAGELQSHARALRVRLQLPPLHDATGHRGRD